MPADRETLPPEVDCTTPETCGICHRCQQPEPHECVVSVPRETLDRWEMAMESAAGCLGDVEAAGWSPAVDPKRWAEQVAAPLRAALAEVRRLRGEGR